ncbi:MAG: hypothetical protein CO135_00870 [Candidatus Levybacteria bacterium CG_4_9_14_3_um_filter_35_16]|nr:MAG: hypothetical protein COW87_00540 [Candidatus Levybacteria bacterium CG22_combo_CG10-13_8_21_14_all_35_11]PIY94276.1 MAG: hypothetical protein COY68_03365 [Candidatus Levybacteria bacterium CG_4_10_14_0_8_um_filter_35_23]PJA91510.1 MAG: hypothetical protein CO135_00870 [Candidatus Levybacteria bacterium CG_4_9_14_3_um_filter_35_16]PJC54127.1 MAG: hypothetical protein CO028_03970 [Candidatus Levybacteria bacterium CG_4_9_14_0_2_um_filter_35_21]
MKCVFFGGSSYVIPILKVLKSKLNLSLVITTERESNDPVISFCIENKILYLGVTSISDPRINSELLSLNPELALVADFRLILPEELLDIFPKGVLNIHPSLLPRYRGPIPGQTAILNGDKSTGVSLIKLDKQIDHGQILVQKEEKILENDTSESLYLRLFELGAKLFSEKIDDYLNGRTNLKKQNDTLATFTKILSRDSGYFDFSNPPTKEVLDQMIKAFYPWPGSWTKIRIMDNELRIKFLPGEKLQIEGKKPVSYKDFINGYPKEGKEILKKLNLV